MRDMTERLAVYENVNLDTLTASYNEIKGKSESLRYSGGIWTGNA